MPYKTGLKPGGLKRTFKKKKDTFADIRREYGLPDFISSKDKLRFSSPIERGILWYWFSRYIREVRDAGLACISCGKHKDEYQGGHFIPTGSVGWDEFVFSEENVHKECANCNHRDKRKLGYGAELDRRMPGVRAKLECQAELYRRSGETHKNWTRQQYREKIRHYRYQVETLSP